MAREAPRLHGRSSPKNGGSWSGTPYRSRRRRGWYAGKLRVAVVGVGAMGTHHARILSRLPGSELVGVADVRENAARKVGRRFRVPTFRSASALLRATRPDAITIATPTASHANVARQAFDAGCHVLVEKPITSTVAQAHALIHEAKRRKRILAVGLIERFNPAVAALRRLVAEGTFGRIITIGSRRVGAFPPSVRERNLILDLAIHDLDLFQYLVGEPIVSARADAGGVHGGRLDHAEILIRSRSATGLLQVNWITPVKVRTLTVTGTRGYAEVDELAQTISVARLRRGRTFLTYSEFVRRFGAAPMRRIPVERAEPLERELASFLTCVRLGRTPAVTGEDGLAALKAANLVLKSL